MVDYQMILRDGLILSAVVSIYLLMLVKYNNRLLLNPGDYPPDVIAAVPPKTKEEQRLSVILGMPFMLVSLGYPLFSVYQFIQQAGGEVPYWVLFAHVFGVASVFFFFDLLVLDLWLFCTVTPDFVVIPGTEGFAGYKDKSFHLKAHARGFFVFLLPASLLMAGIALQF